MRNGEDIEGETVEGRQADRTHRVSPKSTSLTNSRNQAHRKHGISLQGISPACISTSP